MKWVIYDSNTKEVACILENETYEDGSFNIISYNNFDIKEYGDETSPILDTYIDTEKTLLEENVFLLEDWW